MARGCQGLDMGGYRIFRTHITMRRRVVRRAIRCFTRAWAEYKRTGALQWQRATAVIARHGPVHFADSENFRKKYHVPELLRAAKRVTAYWQRVQTRKRKEFFALCCIPTYRQARCRAVYCWSACLTAAPLCA